jgi:pimeloyl-ACP methyl ester carboxylesterase
MSVVSVNGQEFYYTDTQGEGPGVVFSHGALLDSAMWDETVRGLGAGVRAVALDARLHGQTPGTSTDFTFWDSARDVLGLMDALGIGRAVLAGHSQGGFTALRAALLAPERVSGLVLVDTMSVPWPPEAAAQTRGARDGLAAAGPTPWPPRCCPA